MNPDYRSIQRILIANRGEIACRVMRSARALGIGSVAVHSDIDRHARHVAEADIAVDLGGAKPRQLPARRQDHRRRPRQRRPGDPPRLRLPLGERRLRPRLRGSQPPIPRAAGGAIDAMGSKSAAKALMEEAGVPLVPGYHGEAQDAETFRREAGRIGYPVLLGRPAA